MKRLKEIYQIFVLLCICPPVKSLKFRIKMIYILISVFCSILLICALIANAVYLMRNLLTDLASTVCAIYQVVALVSGLYSFFLAHVKRHDFKRDFDDFQTFYDTSK